MNLLHLPAFIILYIPHLVSLADPIDKVAELIRSGDIHELSGLFAPTIELSILDDENVYAKAQAELVLQKFFKENKPGSVKVLHKINSNPNYQFGVLIFTSDKSAFRITCTLKQSSQRLALIAMRIEKEKVK
jgi:hypothetical protein